jgi:hypothetical protein
MAGFRQTWQTRRCFGKPDEVRCRLLSANEVSNSNQLLLSEMDNILVLPIFATAIS